MFSSKASTSQRTLLDRLGNIETELEALKVSFGVLAHNVEAAVTRPRGIELLRKLGVTPQRFVQIYYQDQPSAALYDAMFGGSESLRGRPSKIGFTSGLCRQLHFSLDEFRYWMTGMGIAPQMHRKYWEWFYIAQVLFEQDALAPGKKGLVFAVGQEPLPAVFATYGCEILATDQAPDKAIESGWGGNMYSAQVDTLFREDICPREAFFSAVSYQHADMNDIPRDLEGRFDFCWSSCAFEHLGSLEHGMRFVERSIDTLVPGGVAVHTTEFNLSSNDDTMETPGCSIYRRRDIEALIARLEKAGHRVAPVDWATGPGFAETVIDLPPYRQSPHLKLKVAEYECTSIGLIIQKR